MNYNNRISETYKRMEIEIFILDDEKLTLNVRYICGEIEKDWVELYGLDNAIQLAKNYIDRMEKDGKLENPHCEHEYCRKGYGLRVPVDYKSSDVTLELQPADLGLYELYVGSETTQVTLHNWFTMTKQDLSRFKCTLDKLQNQVVDILLRPEICEV